ncbi:NB-ARC domain-containing protein [Streptococcus dysgalactiae]|uniref:NB-ARC domain-containing protein n=1 Tax=Streptococcus dysgalactiae TaxID=1334 RepID=UPI002DD425C7|nr:NB-ARC domain-containing protein [Streptococcus dysgalactiae]MEC4578553.1 NB-ARC domain-containing protein [Streptococcus dysgalactiae]
MLKQLVNENEKFIILIIGPNGAGKSTLARELEKLLNIKVVHLDRVFWKSEWESISQKDLEKNIEKYLNKYGKLILDGDYLFNIEQRLSYADAVIWLKKPILKCLWNVIKRRFKYNNKVRPDMAEGCIERLNIDILFSILTYYVKKAPVIKKILVSNDKVQLIELY